MSDARCRYIAEDDHQCVDYAVDPHTPLLLCLRHMAQAYEILRDRLGRVLAESKGN